MGDSKEPADSSSKSILVVDDDRESRLLLSVLLKKRGYLVLQAESGFEALEWLKKTRPDLVILDIMMPGMDGWETYDQLRTLHPVEIPVLFLTALSSGENAARAIGLGAQDYVRKPFFNDELIARVEALLRNVRPASLTVVEPRTEQRPKVSVILPTLNEAMNLPLVLPYFPSNWVDEIILVDGRSTDGTVEVAKKLLPSIKVVLEKKKGKGAAMQAGYKAASGDILIVLDADGSHDPREIPRYVTALLEGADFAKGSRFAPGGGTTDMPRYRQFGNWIFVMLSNLLFCATFTDLCYGYHAFWRYCLEAIDLSDVDGFEIDTAIYLEALRSRLRVTDVPSFEGYRFYGKGKLRTIPDGFKVLMTILREDWKSLRKKGQRENYIGFRGKPIANL